MTRGKPLNEEQRRSIAIAFEIGTNKFLNSRKLADSDITYSPADEDDIKHVAKQVANDLCLSLESVYKYRYYPIV